MTFKELSEQTRREVDDETGNTDADKRVRDWQILAYANEAELEACIRGRLLVDSSTTEICMVPIEAVTTVYAYDPRILFIVRGKMSGATRPLTRASYTMLDERYPGWEDQTGEVETFVTGMDKNRLRLFKKPTAAGQLNLSVIRRPLQPMKRSTDVPEIPAHLHASLVLWMKHKIYMNQDYELFDKNRADVHLAAFEEKFGKRPADVGDIFDAMQIPTYTPELCRGGSDFDSSYF